LRKYFKNRKGFTLVELMMVIAVIGILAAVLIPKIGSTKNTARLAGVESNTRQVVAQVHGLVERYKHHGDDFAAALVEAINSDGSDTNGADSGDISNPFVSNLYGATSGSLTADADNADSPDVNYAVYVDDDGDNDNDPTAPGTDTDFKGLIYVTVTLDDYDTSNDIANITEVKVTPYNEDGEQMSELITTITLN